MSPLKRVKLAEVGVLPPGIDPEAKVAQIRVESNSFFVTLFTRDSVAKTSDSFAIPCDSDSFAVKI